MRAGFGFPSQALWLSVGGGSRGLEGHRGFLICSACQTEKMISRQQCNHLRSVSYLKSGVSFSFASPIKAW